MRKIIPIFFVLTTAFAQSGKTYLFSKEIQQQIDNDKNTWQLQTYAVQYSKIGNYKASLATNKKFAEVNSGQMNMPKAPISDSIGFASYVPENAVNAIANEAKKYQVVITNEAHYQPQNRVFTSLLLDRLYTQGFRYLCVEDFVPTDTVYKTKQDTELNARKYPVQTTGNYINEPQYGNMIRHALQLGYTLVSYDYYASDKKEPLDQFIGRENGQAKNIAQILQKDPGAKILVHCGYGHLNENVTNNFGMMAAMLKINHNIDPLTIDQQDLLEENNKPYSKWANVKEPSVYKSEKGFFGNKNDNHQVDMVVVFPKTKYLNGRPDWLMYDKNRRYYFPGLASGTWVYPIMVSAFYKNEDLAVAIPTDIIEIEKPEDKTALVLNKGVYILKIRDFSGTETTQEITIK